VGLLACSVDIEAERLAPHRRRQPTVCRRWICDMLLSEFTLQSELEELPVKEYTIQVTR